MTLEQLLSHTSGIPGDTGEHEKLVQQSFTQAKLNLDEVRYWLSKQFVMGPVRSKPVGNDWRARPIGRSG